MKLNEMNASNAAIQVAADRSWAATTGRNTSTFFDHWGGRRAVTWGSAFRGRDEIIGTMDGSGAARTGIRPTPRWTVSPPQRRRWFHAPNMHHHAAIMHHPRPGTKR